ncbi:uncharacterized protein LOC142748274 [Rhinoderma darwinii]|uniref:uncharacterized protein LOC142748274 n=1 Tax=Rhinoderma darwinii TaxID=43563 RepID=UPI003F6627B9
MAEELLRKVAQRVAAEGPAWLESLLEEGERRGAERGTEQSGAATRGPRRERSRRGRKRRAGGHRRHGHHGRRRSGDGKRRGRRYSSSSSDGFSSSSASSGSWRRSSRRSSRPQRRSRRREVQSLSVDQEQLSQVVPPAGPVEEVQAVVPVPRQVAEGPSGVGGTSERCPGFGNCTRQLWQKGCPPPSLMGPGRGQLMRLLRGSVVPATWKSHCRAWDRWLEIAGNDFPSQEGCHLDVTIASLVQIRQEGGSAATASKFLAGVAFMLKLWGCRDVTKEFVVRQSLKGWKKEACSRDTRRPVSFSLLGRLLAVLCFVCRDEYEVSLFGAAFSLAFFAALRVSELVPHRVSASGGLLGSDVVTLGDSLRVCVRRSKTDVVGKGAWLSIGRIGGQYCPVKWVQEFVLVRVPGTQFLIHQDGSAMSRFQFEAIFKAGLKYLGLPPGEFGTHSFRIGAATEADALGLDSAAIMSLGRWRSNSYKSYVRPDLVLKMV